MPYGGRYTGNTHTDAVQVADIVTTVGNPGADTKVPSEQAVREALSGGDEKARVSANDTTPGYLNGKLTAGTGVTLTENNNAGDETLSVSATAASATAAGIVELATAQEINTGTDTVRAMTPAGLQTSTRNIRYLIWRAVAAGTSLTGSTGTALESVESPISGTIVNDATLGIRPVVRNDTAGTGTGAASYDIHLGGSSIFSVPLTINASQATSRTATPCALSTTAVTAGQVFEFFCDTPQNGTAEKGATFIIPVLMS